MRRLLLAVLATHNLAHAGVIMVDDVVAKKQTVAGSAAPASTTANAAVVPANQQSAAVTPATLATSAAPASATANAAVVLANQQPAAVTPATSATPAVPASATAKAAVVSANPQPVPVTPATSATPAAKDGAPTSVSASPTATAPVDSALQRRVYQLKYSDVTIRLAMKRWLKETGMQLAYEAQKDFPVPVEGDYTGTISDVTLKLMTSLSESSYPLRACEYDNRVVLVVHRDDKCPLEDKQ